jgi:uncharacterized membrane protein (DUF2068 family)
MPLPDRHLPQRRRPLGLSITAVWFLLSGLAISAGSVRMIISEIVSIQESSHSTSHPAGAAAVVLGHSVIAIMGMTLTFGSMSIIAGIGLLKMKPWGFWLGMISAIAFAFVNFKILLSQLDAIIRYSRPSSAFVVPSLAVYVPPFMAGIGISIASTLYLYKIRSIILRRD